MIHNYLNSLHQLLGSLALVTTLLCSTSSLTLAQDTTSTSSKEQAGNSMGTLIVKVSGQQYKGAPSVTVLLNDRVLDQEEVQAVYQNGQWDTLSFHLDSLGPGDRVAVSFTNDLYDGTPEKDRNLIIGDITYNGEKLNVTGYQGIMTPVNNGIELLTNGKLEFSPASPESVQNPATSCQTRVYFAGNSVTDMINYKGLVQLAASKLCNLTWGRHVIPGAGLSWIWQHADSGFEEEPFGYYPKALSQYEWDALVLEPFDRTLSGDESDVVMVSNFLNFALPKSPNLQLYIYQRWPRLRGEPTADNWNQLWTSKYTGKYDNSEETRDYFEQLLGQIRTRYPSIKAPLLVPVGEVMYEINKKMQNGQIPGYSSIWQLYSDDIHLNNVGQYLVATTFFTSLYQESPIGVTVPVEYGAVPTNLALTIQETVWEVYQRYSLTH